MTSDSSPAVGIRPVQLIPLPDGVIVKRGRMEFKVAGAGAYDVVLAVLDLAARGLPREQIAQSFAAVEQPSVLALLNQLEQHRLLAPVDSPSGADGPETPLELFYWSAGYPAEGAAERSAKARITVVGVNEVSRALVGNLDAAGFCHIDVVNYPFLCNLRLLDDAAEPSERSWGNSLPTPMDYAGWIEQDHADIDCLIATSDFGGLALMRVWNEYCAKRGVPFLPVVLQDLIGYLGPLYVPGETACFECARARQNSNMDDPASRRAAEPLAFAGQGVTAAYHPALPAVLGNLAALEISRFVGEWAPPRTFGTLIELDLLTPHLIGRPVLRLPRCRVCGESGARSTTELFRTNLLPATSGHYE